MPSTPRTSSGNGDPSTNGDMRHRPAGKRPPPRTSRSSRASGSEPAQRRGRWWVVTVAVVSAGAGAGLLFGFVLAYGVRAIASGAGDSVLFIPVVIGAIAGVAAGSWLTGRLTGGNRRRFVASTIGGVVGLAVAVGMPFIDAPILSALLPLVAILCPGAGAALGTRIALRGQPMPVDLPPRNRPGSPGPTRGPVRGQAPGRPGARRSGSAPGRGPAPKGRAPGGTKPKPKKAPPG